METLICLILVLFTIDRFFDSIRFNDVYYYDPIVQRSMAVFWFVVMLGELYGLRALL